jgi:GNAT superfamily N-acetyltransferase
MEQVVRTRAATEADGLDIGAVHGASFAAGYGHIFDPAFLERSVVGRARAWPRVIGDLLRQSRSIVVATVDDRIVAFSNSGPADDGGGTGEIYAFFAHADVWGTVVASTLMAETIAVLARDWDTITLWTLEGAHRAQHFYEKAGFERTGAQRVEPIGDWLTNAIVECRAIEFRRPA